ncbi:glycosyltransferase family 2 protein [Marinobacter vinifirmus]|uniref:Glycosyltransferase family 2 protein n=1 Tax=Marinobacter vinifirmus TaxID=355591 RepID=A0A558B371_9GAMM|nr:glycosyltransferase family 2 protein [Marinobacter vinifirmus]TVT30960.1 MAG: glycosyltransferase family 2 protein [Marinobacter vinifirmus]
MSNGMDNGAKPRVKLCAIAKDEGAYLAYWVFHHLYFGFDEIHICLNRTTDNSAAILDEIAKAHPNVTYSYYDWVDLLPRGLASRLQYVAYARELVNAREQARTDYICFLDIDEFWTPKGWDKSIQDCLLEHDCPSSLSFLWANEPGKKDAFSMLPSSGQYLVTGQLKTVFRIGLDLNVVQPHIPLFQTDVKCLMAGGKSFLPAGNRSQVHRLEPGDTRDLPFFLVHRMCRSPVEYMYTLLRGAPSKYFELRMNRNRGYFSESQCNFEHSAPAHRYTEYLQSISRLLTNRKLNDLIETDKSRILDIRERFYEAFEVAAKNPDNKELLLRNVEGLSDLTLDSLIRRLYA